jgi:uncharacterized protein YuzE
MNHIVRYDRDVDALYIDLSEAPVFDTREIEPGVMLDYDADGNVIGVEILDFEARLKEQSQADTLQEQPIPERAA